ncbi:MAG TPA: VacB/RNase II family 3'-5' exoribonuclease [Terriglobales bacterium]|nr:VacB/RNase II family 3'-5' exoribonuclease [Terriglobales bacterium]
MSLPSDSAILRHVERQAKHAAGFKQLVRELGVHGEERRELSDRLQQLVMSGKLVRLDADRFAIPQAAAAKNTLAGRLTMHRDGYGFVIPETSSIPEHLRSQLSGDLFIPPPAVASAMHGDRVLAEIITVRPDGRAEGRVIRVIGRAHATVVGTFHYGSRYNYVRPMDEKITQDIVIPTGSEVSDDGKPRSEGGDQSVKKRGSVHRVLGAEARRTEWDDLENVVVDVEITDWPSATQNARGRVAEILGYEDDFGVDVEIIIRKFHLPHRFPPEVLEEAQSAEPIVSSHQLKLRRDYRDLPIVTIDGETARDFDDAVLVRRLDNGNYELQVHIADVAHYVTPDSALDQEARLRGTSVYFPDRAVPMLPLELSTDICSLRPHLDRLVMSCVIEIDHRGEIVGYDINEGVIRSAERMTYTDVNLCLEGDAAARKRYASLVDQFELMGELEQILNRKRARRGSIDFDLPEPVIEFDEHGLMKSITRSERNLAHRIIEEFMLAANECVAHYMEDRHIASLYRIHEKPDAKRVYDFETIAATFGYSLGVGALPIARVQLKGNSRAKHGSGRNVRQIEIPKEVHITPRMYQKLTEKIAGKPEERILSFLMLRSLKQARYSEENSGHFALAATAYTHFTSPIRRYPDLIVHRILKHVLHESKEQYEDVRSDGQRRGNKRSKTASAEKKNAPSPWSKRRDHAAHREQFAPTDGPLSPEELHDVAEESSQSERRADEAERELMEWKKVKFMGDRVGDDFDGLIISVTKFGFFVELSDLFVEGLVPLSTLTDDHYTYHENTKQIIGQRSRKTYRLGDRVRVLVDRIDPVEKKIQFAVLEEAPARKQKGMKRR